MSSASKVLSKKSHEKLIVPSNVNAIADGYTYYTLRTVFSIDNMLSPNYSENIFVQTVGAVGFWPGKCGSSYGIFLFRKLC